MSTVITFNGASYTIPSVADASWGANVSAYLIAIASGTLQRSGGSFTLTSDIDFGSNYGLKAAYFLTKTATPADAGVLRLANGDLIEWRNATNDGNITLGVDSLGNITVNGSPIAAGLIVNTDIDAAAAIARSKMASGTAYRILANTSAGVMGENAALTALYALYADANGQLATEQYLAKTRGGTGITSSATFPATGTILTDAAGSIARANIAAGTAYRMLANNSAGGLAENAALTAAYAIYADANGQLAGEQYVAKTRGGTGITSTATFPASGTVTTSEAHTVATYEQLTATTDPASPGAASNDVRLYAMAKKLYTVTDDGSGAAIVAEVGSGASGGAINYITDKNAEGNTVGAWIRYADADASSLLAPGGATPGTDGSPNAAFTFTVTNSAPLRGSYSYLITKDANNRQGLGISTPITIDAADKAKMLTISFDYLASAAYLYGSGVASDPGDLVVYIVQDPAGTPVVIQPTNFMLNGSGKFVGQFQADSTVTSYQLCIHVAGTNAAAWTCKLDNISVGPSNVVKGPTITDWVSYTPTSSIWGTTNVTHAGKWRRIGDSMQVTIKSTTSGGVSGDYKISIPAPFVIDTAKISSLGQNNLGSANIVDNGVRAYVGSVTYENTTEVMVVQSESGNTGVVNGTSPFTLGNLDTISLSFIVPIVGWGSNTVISSQDDGRLIASRAYGQQTLANMGAGNVYYLAYATKDYDTHSAITNGAATGTTEYTNGTYFTAPVSGKYRVKASAYIGGTVTWAANDSVAMGFKVEGTVKAYSRIYAATTTANQSINPVLDATINLTAGQRVSVFLTNSTNDTIDVLSDNNFSFFEVQKLVASETIAASEVVAARYKSSAATTLSHTVDTQIPFATKDFDTHAAYSSGKFYAPISGVYKINFKIATAIASWTAGAYIEIDLKRNGSAHSTLNQKIFDAAISTTGIVAGEGVAQLNSGDYLEIFCHLGFGSDVNLSANALDNWASFTRIGGVM